MKFLIFFVVTFLTLQGHSQTLVQENGRIKVIIENIPNNEGQIIVKFYRNEPSFPKTPFQTSKIPIKNNHAEYLLTDVVAGTYAIAIIHDKNSNGKLDFNFLHIPSEKVAASNNAKGFMGPPKWKDAQFLFNGTEVIQRLRL